MFKQYVFMTPRFIFASWYFFIGGIQQLINGDAVKDAVQAGTSFEQALAQTHYMKLLLCIGCIVGGGLLFFRRTRRQHGSFGEVLSTLELQIR